MKTINLRDYYPHYKGNKTVEVPDEIADLLEDYERKEESYHRCLRRFHVFFSLDEGDDVERRALVHGRSPLDILEEQRTTAILYRNIAKLPEKQGRRIYAHFFLGMSQSEIARLEGCHRSTVKESIDSGLIALEKLLEKFS